MLKCSNPDCGRLQETGKFCGACGSPLEEMAGQAGETFKHGEETIVEEVTPVQAEEVVTAHIEPAKVQETLLVEKEEQVDSPSLSEAPTQILQPEVEAEPVQPVQQQVNVAQEEIAAANAPLTPASQGQQQTGANGTNKMRAYWEYSVALLKNPGMAFSHKEDKFAYGLINLGLYAFTFALIIYTVARRTYNDMFGNFGDTFGMDAGGELFQVLILTFIGIAIMLAVLVGSIFVVEKVMVKQMSFKELVVQYSGLLVPFIFLQVGTFLFSFVGTRFVTFTLLGLSFFFALYFLVGLFMYEKVTYYQSSPHRVYTAIGTLIFVSIAYTIVTIVLGASLFEVLLDMVDVPYYGF